MSLRLRISNKWKSVSEQMPYEKCHNFEITLRIFKIRIRGFKLTFADSLKFSLVEDLTYEIDD
jgi:hypothetical protein